MALYGLNDNFSLIIKLVCTLKTQISLENIDFGYFEEVSVLILNLYLSLSYDVTVIQLKTSCHK